MSCVRRGVAVVVPFLEQLFLLSPSTPLEYCYRHTIYSNGVPSKLHSNTFVSVLELEASQKKNVLVIKVFTRVY